MITKMGRFSTKYGRFIFFALLVIVCISFALDPSMLSCNDQQRGDRVAGTLFGEEVSRAEFENVKDRWKDSRTLLFQMQKTQRVFMTVVGAGEDQADQMRMIRFYYGEPSEEDMTAVAWRALAFLHEAKKDGIVVTDVEVADVIQDAFGGDKFDQKEYLDVLDKRYRMSVGSFEETVREALLLSRYFGFVSDGAVVGSEDVFNEYIEKNEKIRVWSVKFSAKDFEDRVRLSPTRHAVRPVDESKRPVVIDGDTIFAYYLREKDPQTVEPKVRLEYAFADYSAFSAGITPPTETDMQMRYELEKATYLIKTTDGVYKPLDEVSADIRRALQGAVTEEKAKQQYEADKETKYKKEGGYVPFDEVKEQIRKDLLAAVDDAAVKAEYEKTKLKYLIKDDDKRYKPYEEVKEGIRKALEKDQAAERAIQKLTALRDEVELARMYDETAKVDMVVLASKHGLAYGKTGLFDEKHMTAVNELFGVSEDLKRLMEKIGDFPVDTVFDRLDTEKGSFVARIDEKIDRFVPPLTVPLRRKLAQQLVHATAQKLAFRAAQELHREGRKRIDLAAEEWGKAHPLAPQEEKNTALQSLRRDVFQRLVTERGLFFAKSEPLRRREGAEAEMFGEVKYEIQLLPRASVGKGEGGEYADNYWVSQLMEMQQPDGKDFELMRSSLREQLQGEKSREFLNHWLTEVWAAAKLEDRIHTQPTGENTPPPDELP
ncbi:MAG: SurA N-terminal domain-containing protein [Planctomycetota bacterium]